MSNLLKTCLQTTQIKAVYRAFSCSPLLESKSWRANRGLPVNRTSEGVLTDAPDYTFLDGRPTPLLHKQKQRLLKQQQFASQIVELSAELEFAKDRLQTITKAEEEEKQKYISNRLKPKGQKLNRK